jgi:hypothetical protein
MKQQINLYLPEFKVEKDPLTVLVMAQVLAVMLAIMIVVSSYEAFTRWQLGTELADLRVTLAEETRNTAALDAELSRRSQNVELSNRLDRAEAVLASSQQVRDFLSGAKLGNVSGFSEYFKDLSRAAIDGLSISEFTFTDGGETATLSGRVADSAMVPRYVANFEDGISPLKTKHFNPSISRPDVEIPFFDFVLSTTSE